MNEDELKKLIKRIDKLIKEIEPIAKDQDANEPVYETPIKRWQLGSDKLIDWEQAKRELELAKAELECGSWRR